MSADSDTELTLKEASAEFGVSYSRLKMAAWQGRIAARKPGHDYLVRRADVEAFLRTARRGRPQRRSGGDQAD
jgi:excisionase family DNA binding protein